MGLFDGFPFSNLHELNLDWILSKLKDVEKVKEATDKVEENVRKTETNVAICDQYRTSAWNDAERAGLSEFRANEAKTVCENVLDQIEAIPAGQLTLLWRNADVASGMGGTRITLPANSLNCFGFVVTAKLNNTSSYSFSSIIFRTSGTRESGALFYPNCQVGGVLYPETGRGYRLGKTGDSTNRDVIQFWTPYRDGAQAPNTVAVPYEIYGIMRGDL